MWNPFRHSESRTCPSCGEPLNDPPTCYGADAPWRLLGVSESEVASRVEVTPDQCVVDGTHFFVRGHLPVSVIGASSPFLWSVWCSLSERSFEHMSSRWTSPDRFNDAPYFGWLMSRLPGYPETLHLQASVQSRAVGEVPHITVFEPPDHPLVLEQRDGITMDRVREFARLVFHSHGGA